MDALRSYEEQGWRDLAAQTRLELVAAAKKMNDMDRCVLRSVYILGKMSGKEVLCIEFG